MPQYYVRLTEPVATSYFDEIHRRIFFLSEEIEDFAVESSDDQIVAVSIRTGAAADPAELADRLNRMMRSEVLRQRPARHTVIWRSAHPARVVEDTFEQLVERGIVSEAGEGQYALGPDFVTALSYIDAQLSDIALSRFSALEYRYPTLISADAISRTGYPASFPQFLMSVSRLHADSSTYREFLNEVTKGSDIIEATRTHSRQTGYMLPPTMCFHVYHQLKGRRLDPGDNAVYTTKGKSFRHESRYRRGLERLWDFTIREIVFVGGQDWVVSQRRAFMDATLRLVEELGLGGHVEVANDPFFGDADTAERIVSQRLLHLKYELRLPVADGRTVAVGSFNIHGTKFSESFGIELSDGTPAHTSCVGFGLERFAYALVCRYGTDPAAWPEPRAAR
ncbi:class-II aminoacyl-tRNA synthetase family protein [Streptomyces europaeiscabiei]|uniref:hypothetical protein n=1 Tax=Streptomyces europaeiscabiei TaxID=146819 RepID=UPI0029BE53CB|nr:hypothetical protein [Streptomyces europaeiscabiei]MDX3611295.1 hypothetical protein [Streptomyces europaeiscabiei]